MIEDNAKKQIKIAFRMYPIWKEEIKISLDEVGDKSLGMNAPNAVRSGRTKPRATKKTFDVELIELMEKDKYKWVKIVSELIEFYKDSDKGKLLELKYMSQYMSVTVMSMMLHISRAQLFNWDSDIVNKAYRLAVSEELLPA